MFKNLQLDEDDFAALLADRGVTEECGGRCHLQQGQFFVSMLLSLAHLCLPEHCERQTLQVLVPPTTGL